MAFDGPNPLPAKAKRLRSVPQSQTAFAIARRGQRPRRKPSSRRTCPAPMQRTVVSGAMFARRRVLVIQRRNDANIWWAGCLRSAAASRRLRSCQLSITTTNRIAHCESIGAYLRGSARSRPDSHARQNICAGPMIWLIRIEIGISRATPDATSGSNQLAIPFRKASFSACCFLRKFTSHSARDCSNRNLAFRRSSTTHPRYAATSVATPVFASGQHTAKLAIYPVRR
jgi:hypothetical protein